MDVQDTLYPFELLSLLDALREGDFTGAVQLHAESGTTVLYVVDGQVRYATTTDVQGSFPAYLITEDVFPAERVRGWLDACTDDEITFEDFLLERRRIDPEGLVQLKADLGRLVFASAFNLTASVHVEPAHGPPPDFGEVVLDPYAAIFQCVVEMPLAEVFAGVLSTYRDRPLRRGPEFFVMLPALKHWFPHPQVPRFLAEPSTLDQITQGMSDRREEALLAEVFAMRLAGMIHFQGEPPRRALLRHPVRRRRRGDPGSAPGRARTRREPAEPRPPATESGDTLKVSGSRGHRPDTGSDHPASKTTKHPAPVGGGRSGDEASMSGSPPAGAGTQPGARMSVDQLHAGTRHGMAAKVTPSPSWQAEVPAAHGGYDHAFELALDGPAGRADEAAGPFDRSGPRPEPPRHAVDDAAPVPAHRSPASAVAAEPRGGRTSFVPRAPAPQEPEVPHNVGVVAESFADLRGSLVGQGLIEAAERSREQDLYSFLAVEPTAPLSDIRGAHMKAARRYAATNYQGFMLPGAAGAALRALQARTEEAYETLIDLRKRREHDRAHRVVGCLNQPELEDLFYAEGVFKAAQIRMASGSNADAVSLLEDAISKNGREPEYRSYLAWALFGAGLAGDHASSRLGGPDELLATALEMRPKLESAWLFKARIADHRGDGASALAAYYSVLNTNPDNDEARLTIRAYREAGIEPARQERTGLAERIAQMLRR